MSNDYSLHRKNHQRAMESMSASLESEQKAKGEALRVKKALEGEINELEIGLDHANKANTEGLKSIKRYQTQIKDTKRPRENEIADGRNAGNNMQVINGRDMTAKRGLEGAIHTIQAEVDAMLGAAKNAEEKSKRRWSTLLALLMSSVLSRTTLTPRPRPS